MAPLEQTISADPRRPRRWQFGDALFDEGAWSLSVAGVAVAMEKKPLQLLRALLERPGMAISKDELLEVAWPGLSVVEASVPTAIAKLRRALNDGQDGRSIIETVPGVGYRLAGPVTLVAAHPAAAERVAQVAAPQQPARRWLPWVMALAAAVVAIMVVRGPLQPAAPATQMEIFAALRALDVGAVRVLLDRGWDPNAPLDTQRNGALNRVLEACESGKDHVPDRLAAVVRLLMDAGARPDVRNVWGDTAYSIASANRYCGPDHPATRAISAACRTPEGAFSPACLADYAHSEWPQMPRRATGGS